MSQGANANNEGKQNVEMIVEGLHLNKFREVTTVRSLIGCNPVERIVGTWRNWLYDGTWKGIYLRDVVVCNGIWNPFEADFILYRPEWPEPLALATQAQRGPGTAYMKQCFVWNNIMLPQCPFRWLLHLEGEGFPPYVRKWAKNRPEESRGKVVRVFDGITEFRHWLIEGATYPHINCGSLFLEVNP